MTKSVYKKDNSFVGFSGVGTNVSGILKRVSDLKIATEKSKNIDYRQSVLLDACRGLLEGAGESDTVFWLRPHIIKEIERVSEGDMADYLFYRYRYDVFPAQKKTDAFPPCVQVEPTSVCNYRCVFCYQVDQSLHDRSAGHKGRMELALFKRVIDQIEGEVQAVTLASRGEPLLCKDIVKMLEYLSGKFLGLKINTNAWYLNEEKAHALLASGANTIVFSADAADEELYAKLRVNGELERVLENIKLFKSIKEKHYPESSTISRVSGVKFTEQQDFDAVEEFWKDHVDQVAFVEFNPWVSVYDAEDTGVNDACSDLWRRTFVWWDGRVNPCDVDYLSSLSVGHVDNATISEIWNGEAYQGLRQKHLDGLRNGITPCRKCALV